MPGVFSVFTDLRTLLLFLVTFTLIIAVHEFGHYISARLAGMKVQEFGFGFPPRAFALRHAGIDYSVNWIPFGGFVRILGQDDFNMRQAGEGEPGSFSAKPWYLQAVVLVAGVTMNFVLAIVVLTIAFASGTTAPTGDVRVVDVAPNSPAAAAGFRAGDLIKVIDGRPITSSHDLVLYVQRHTEREVAIDIARNGRPMPTIRVVPRAEPPEGEGPIGIRLEDVVGPVAVPPPQAFLQSLRFSRDILVQIAELPGQLLSRGPATPGGGPQVGGPIAIFQVTGRVAEFGLPTFLQLIGLLSLNLAALNIVPFPGLDGGRLFFVLIGGIFRRRLSPQVEAAIHAVGFALLIGLLIVVSVADIRRVVGG